MIQVNPRERENLSTGRPELLVVLDAANIGWAYSRDQRFDVTGVEAAIRFFKSLPQVTVTGFLPAAMVRRRPAEGSGGMNAKMQTDELERLNALVQQGDIIVVPAGDDDDVYALHWARNNSGFIVSNDFFGNHVNKIQVESLKRSMQLWLSENRVSYTFGPDGNILINPSCALFRSLTLLQQVHSSEQAKDGMQDIPQAVLTSLASIDQTVSSLVIARRPEALKFALLARLSLRFDVGMLQGCLQDAQTILSLVRGLFICCCCCCCFFFFFF